MQQQLTHGWLHCAEGVTGKRATEVTLILDRLLKLVELTGSGVGDPQPALPDSLLPPLPTAMPGQLFAVAAPEPTGVAVRAARVSAEPAHTERSPPFPSSPPNDAILPMLGGYGGGLKLTFLLVLQCQ